MQFKYYSTLGTLGIKEKNSFDLSSFDSTPVGTEDELVWCRVAGEGRLAPGLGWASVVGLVGVDFVALAGLDLELEALEVQVEGVTETAIGLIY